MFLQWVDNIFNIIDSINVGLKDTDQLGILIKYNKLLNTKLNMEDKLKLVTQEKIMSNNQSTWARN